MSRLVLMMLNESLERPSVALKRKKAAGRRPTGHANTERSRMVGSP